MSHLVQEKYEQRAPSGDLFDDYVAFLSGELLDGSRRRNMEVSYTKEQQKQKQKQQNKTKDSDVMEVFDEARQVVLEAEMEDYFEYSLDHDGDLVKKALALPVPVPICKLAYTVPGSPGTHWINIYPTLQVRYNPSSFDKIGKEIVLSRIFLVMDFFVQFSGMSKLYSLSPIF